LSSPVHNLHTSLYLFKKNLVSGFCNALTTPHGLSAFISCIAYIVGPTLRYYVGIFPNLESFVLPRASFLTPDLLSNLCPWHLIPNRGDHRLKILSVLYKSSEYRLHAGWQVRRFKFCRNWMLPLTMSEQPWRFCISLHNIGIPFAILYYGIWKMWHWLLHWSNGNKVCRHYIAHQLSFTR